MEAVNKQYPSGAAAVKALAAGADLLLMPADVEQAHAAIVRAVASGGLCRRTAGRSSHAGGHHDDLARPDVARRRPPRPAAARHCPPRSPASAVTILAGTCSGPLVPGAVRVTGGGPGDRERFEAAAARAGLAVGSGTAGQPHRLRRPPGRRRHRRRPGCPLAAAGFPRTGQDCAVTAGPTAPSMPWQPCWPERRRLPESCRPPSALPAGSGCAP